jgi:hypothetical protein
LASGEAFASSQVGEDKNKKTEKMANTLSAVQVSVAVVVVWVVIVTVALVVIGLVSFRRWRRDSFATDQGSAASLSVASAEDLGDISSDFGSIGEPTPVSQRRGAQNHGFQGEPEDALSAEEDVEASDLGSVAQPPKEVDIADVHISNSTRTEGVIS